MECLSWSLTNSTSSLVTSISTHPLHLQTTSTSDSTVIQSTDAVHCTPWQTNAPVTPSPSSKLPTAISSPGAAQTAIPARSWLSGGARSVATVGATPVTPQRHSFLLLSGTRDQTGENTCLWHVSCMLVCHACMQLSLIGKSGEKKSWVLSNRFW